MSKSQVDQAPAISPLRIPAALRSLRHRNFQLFFAGQLISLIGTWMQTVAQSWLVYRLTGSALLLGTVGFASQIPVFLLAPLGGTAADRRRGHRRHSSGADRRRLVLFQQRRKLHCGDHRAADDEGSRPAISSAPRLSAKRHSRRPELCSKHGAHPRFALVAGTAQPDGHAIFSP